MDARLLDSQGMCALVALPVQGLMRAGPGGAKPSQVDLRFRQRFSRILRLLRPYPALALAALSILESVAVAEGALWVSRRFGRPFHPE
jgi:hypothetical protein